MHSAWRDPTSPSGAFYCVRGRSSWALSVEPPLPVAGVASVAAALALGAGVSRGRSSVSIICASAVAAAFTGIAFAAASTSAVPQQTATISFVHPARVPNGMAWTADGTKMYWIDSATNKIELFDFDPASGNISARRTAVNVPPIGCGVHGSIGGVPDGMCIDANGKLWCALAESGAIAQYCPESGRQITACTLPVKRVTACTFGGENLDELYVTTRSEKGQVNAGGLFRIRVPGVRGLHGAYSFSG